EHPMPLAAMVQGGYTHTSEALPEPAAPHFATNDNLSVDQVSVFLATRLFDHVGMFAQGTYSGEDRHFSWDNVDIRWARPVTNFFGTDAVVGTRSTTVRPSRTCGTRRPRGRIRTSPRGSPRDRAPRQ